MIYYVSLLLDFMEELWIADLILRKENGKWKPKRKNKE